jgi:hypothetical protein
MTLVAGLHLGELVIIAADKREVKMRDNVIISKNDNVEKIISAGIGLITGSGFVNLLQSVKEDIKNSTITDTDQIFDIIQRRREELRSYSLGDKEVTEADIRQTGWLFSYRTVDDNNLPLLRLAIIHQSLGDTIGLYEEGKATAIAPFDSNEEEVKRLSENLTKQLKTTKKIPDLSDTLNYHIPLLQQLFLQVAEVCESVCEEFNIGITTIDGTQMISDTIDSSSTSTEFSRAWAPSADI